MKIQAIKQYNYAQNRIGQTSDKISITNPINFKGGDSFEVNNRNTDYFNIDTSSLPKNIQLKKEYGRKYTEISGNIDDEFFTMKSNRKECMGRHNGTDFNFSSYYKFLGPIRLNLGMFGSKIFHTSFDTIDNNLFIVGEIGDEPIKLSETDEFNSTRIKGIIGKDSIDLVINFSNKGKQVEGIINDNRFVFNDNGTKITGGTEENFKGFPIVLSLIERISNQRQIQQQKERSNELFLEIMDEENHIGG